MANLKFAAFRKLRGFVRDPAGKGFSSLGLTVPKEALRALGWREGNLLQVWYEEEKGIVILSRVGPKESHALPRRS